MNADTRLEGGNLPPKRLGLALGGGAARGFAHVGVLQALSETGIWPDVIVGTSVGSVIGACVAAGKSLDEIVDIAQRFHWGFAARLSWPRQGFFSFAPLERFLVKWLGDLCIEELPLRFACVATDALYGQARLFRDGRLAPRVRASCSVPLVVKPTLIEDRWYIDGGLVDNLPIRFTRALGADVVLAVNLFGPPTHLPAKMETYAAAVIGHTLVQAGDDPFSADVLVEPDLTDFSMVRMPRRHLIDLGYQAMLARLPELQNLLGCQPV